MSNEINFDDFPIQTIFDIDFTNLKINTKETISLSNAQLNFPLDNPMEVELSQTLWRK